MQESENGNVVDEEKLDVDAPESSEVVYEATSEIDDTENNIGEWSI